MTLAAASHFLQSDALLLPTGVEKHFVVGKFTRHLTVKEKWSLKTMGTSMRTYGLYMKFFDHSIEWTLDHCVLYESMLTGKDPYWVQNFCLDLPVVPSNIPSQVYCTYLWYPPASHAGHIVHTCGTLQHSTQDILHASRSHQLLW